MKLSTIATGLMASLLGLGGAQAAVVTYGDQDLVGFGYGGADPTLGATLSGLAPGATSSATNSFGHPFPFSPGGGDFPGTDQIYIGSVQTGAHDGYSGSPQRINGPQTLTLDYSSVVPSGSTITSLTLGIATDDFQFPVFGQPFVATINGNAAPDLTALLNGQSETGPVEHFVSIGLDPALLLPSNVLTLSIDQGGDGGDGWAIDFLTVGVTAVTPGVAEPGTLALFGMALSAFGLARRRSAT